MLTQAQFIGDILQRINAGQEMARGVRADLGIPDPPAASSLDPLSAMQTNFKNLNETAAMDVQSVDQVRCMKHPSLSGDNCEVRLTLVTKDGKISYLPSKYRFDQINGKLTVVGVP